MTTAVSPQIAAGQAIPLPKSRGVYYGGAWHEPNSGRFLDTISPGTGLSLGKVADGGADDIDAAVASAKAAFKEWRRVLPLERAKILRRIAEPACRSLRSGAWCGRNAAIWWCSIAGAVKPEMLKAFSSAVRQSASSSKRPVRCSRSEARSSVPATAGWCCPFRQEEIRG